MKKYLAMLLCGVMLLGASYINVSANEEKCDGNCIVEVNQEEYVDPDWISVANGNVDNGISAYASGTDLYISKYYQDDYLDVMKTCGLTIKAAGCALTSFTMASNYLTGVNSTPSSVNETLENYACPFYWYEAADKFNLTVKMHKTSGLTTSYVTSELVAQLNNYVPVIVGMRYTNGGTHYVLVKGYSLSNGNYTFKINDPSKVYNKQTLAEYQNMGVTFISLTVYAQK